MKIRQEVWMKNLIVFTFIFVAACLRIVDVLIDNTRVTMLLCSYAYIAIFLCWGVAVYRKVTQKQVRNYMIAIAALLVYWMFVRTVKYAFAETQLEMRLLWYQYYIPQTFVPLFSLFVSWSLGKQETYRMPKAMYFLYLPAAFLALTVLTNDCHQLVFQFTDTYRYGILRYTYGFVYYVVMAWAIACGVFSLGIMSIKCRVFKNKRTIFSPLIPFVLIILYSILYLTSRDFIMAIMPDVTVIYCIFYIATFENCLDSGLIPMNTGYNMIFDCLSVPVLITNRDFQVRYQSGSPLELTEEKMKRAIHGVVRLDSNSLLRGNKIQCGYVFWKEDVTELQEILSELEENHEALEERNYVEEEKYRTKRRTEQLREKNRLYTQVQTRISRQIDCLYELLEEYDQTKDQDQKRKILAKSVVLGAYIKRRGNLFYLSEKNNFLDSSDLYLCIHESTNNLAFLGVDCAIQIDRGFNLRADSVIAAYEFFEDLIEFTIDDIQTVFVKLLRENEDYKMIILLESSKDMRNFYSDKIEVIESRETEDGGFRYTLPLKRGGLHA